MRRREFLGAAGAACLGLSGASSVLGDTGSSPGEAAKPSARRRVSKFFIWTGPDSRASAEKVNEKYATLKKRGLTGVFLSGYDAREVASIREAGLEAHIWTWTTNRGERWIRENHPDWYMVSRSGKSCLDHPPYVDYYRWISPVIPGVQSYLKEQVAAIASKEGVSGVHLDYVRYPDVILPKALWKTYNLDQTEELPDYDFCYSEATRKAFRKVSGRDPMEIKDPAHDQEWLHFRYDSVTQLVKQLATAIREHGKEVTAAVFPTPRLARMICRQEWDKWPLDFAAPMIYHSFYEETVDWIGDRVLENIQSAPMPIVAGLYMPAFKTPEEFAQALRLVKKRGGAGVSLFGGVSEEMWRVFEGFSADWPVSG